MIKIATLQISINIFFLSFTDMQISNLGLAEIEKAKFTGKLISSVLHWVINPESEVRYLWPSQDISETLLCFPPNSGGDSLKSRDSLVCISASHLAC